MPSLVRGYNESANGSDTTVSIPHKRRRLGALDVTDEVESAQSNGSESVEEPTMKEKDRRLGSDFNLKEEDEEGDMVMRRVVISPTPIQGDVKIEPDYPFTLSPIRSASETADREWRSRRLNAPAPAATASDVKPRLRPMHQPIPIPPDGYYRGRPLIEEGHQPCVDVPLQEPWFARGTVKRSDCVEWAAGQTFEQEGIIEDWMDSLREEEQEKEQEKEEQEQQVVVAEEKEEQHEEQPAASTSNEQLSSPRASTSRLPPPPPKITHQYFIHCKPLGIENHSSTTTHPRSLDPPKRHLPEINQRSCGPAASD
ncbi:hypothetical protein T439DRAFT_170950 [Meredithblackwellia eburnea MCA 4105]